MKKIFFAGLTLVASFFLGVLPGVAQEGIAFEHGTWAEILAKAKAANKPVFIDIYTDWCMPCKAMVKNIFPLKEVGDKFNASFINYKIDAEKGEGIAVAKSYKVTSYPTYLFVNGDGVLLYRSVGSMPAEKFINEAGIAIGEFNDPKPFAAWEDEYETRKQDTAFLWSYLQKRKKLRMNSADVLDQYYSQLGQEGIWKSPLIRTFHEFQQMNTDGPFFTFLVQEKEAVKKVVNPVLRSRYDQFLIVVANADVERAIDRKDEALLGKIVTLLLSIPPDNLPTDWRGYSAQMKYYTQTNNPKALVQVLDSYHKSIAGFDKNIIRSADSLALAQFDREYASGAIKSMSPENLERTRKARGSTNATSFAYRVRDMAKSVYAVVDDRKQMKRALGWMDLALEFSDNFTLTETRAGLLYKMGNTPEGIQWQEKAIADFKAQMAAMNISSEKSQTRLEDTLAKMKAGKPTWGLL